MVLEAEIVVGHKLCKCHVLYHLQAHLPIVPDFFMEMSHKLDWVNATLGNLEVLEPGWGLQVAHDLGFKHWCVIFYMLFIFLMFYSGNVHK